MSTRIYHGFRIDGTLEKAWGILRKAHPGIRDLVLTNVQRLVYQEALIEFDIEYYTKGIQIERAFSMAKYRIGDIQRDIKRTELRNPQFDWGCDVTIYKYKKSVYGIFRTEQPDVLWDYFLEQPGVNDYSYWNNSDGPEGISDDEWSSRGETWDKILDNYFTTVNLGLDFVFSDVVTAYGVRSAPTPPSFSLKERAKEVALHTVKKPDKFASIMDFMFSDERKELMNEEIDKIIPKLIDGDLNKILFQ